MLRLRVRSKAGGNSGKKSDVLFDPMVQAAHYRIAMGPRTCESSRSSSRSARSRSFRAGKKPIKNNRASRPVFMPHRNKSCDPEFVTTTGCRPYLYSQSRFWHASIADAIAAGVRSQRLLASGSHSGTRKQRQSGIPMQFQNRHIITSHEIGTDLQDCPCDVVLANCLLQPFTGRDTISPTWDLDALRTSC